MAGLNREIVRILASPHVKERFSADGSEVAPPYGPLELRKMFVAEFEKWDAVVKAANLSVDKLY